MHCPTVSLIRMVIIPNQKFLFTQFRILLTFLIRNENFNTQLNEKCVDTLPSGLKNKLGYCISILVSQRYQRDRNTDVDLLWIQMFNHEKSGCMLSPPQTVTLIYYHLRVLGHVKTVTLHSWENNSFLQLCKIMFLYIVFLSRSHQIPSIYRVKTQKL